MRSLVVGTAGHIDHGKTSLVRSLTGVDLDTLPEERERGITISLGFTHLELADGRRVGFVDVPGHERLVRTMVAGATGLDAVLLCVSAVEGAMPQTREHLAILDLLGVRRGLVALTMADLVDAELLELAVEDVRDLVRGTFLEGSPVVPFSSVTGQGRQELLDALGALPDTDRAAEGPFRLPVDRVFVRPGFGTVVTGTAWSGELRDGATVRLLPDGGEARVRGIEVHGERRDAAVAGRRTALNLAGLSDVERGAVVVSGEVPCPSVVDVRYRALADAPELEDGESVRVLHGTTERGARLWLAQEGDTVPPGFDGWLQLRLDRPLPCLAGDRLVVRRASPARTLGGGRIVDPFAPKIRRRDRPEHAAGLDRLDRGDARVHLERAGEAGLGKAELVERGVDPAGAVQLGDRWFAREVVDRLADHLVASLRAWHAELPLARGAPRRDLRRGRLAHLGDRAFDALLDEVLRRGEVELDGPLARIRGFVVRLDPDQAALQARVAAAIEGSGLEGRTDRALAELGPEAWSLVRLLEAEGRVEEVSQLGWIARARLAELEASVRGWFAGHGELSPADFKDLTGLTRKAAIPLLEWLDRRRITRRSGDVRIPGTST